MSAVLFVAFLLAAPPAPAYIPIAAARQQGQGATVTVVGLVTVPSGDFKSSSDDEGFAVQDQTAGIWVSVAKNLHLHLGQKVQVSGTLGTSAGKLQIQSATVKPLAGTVLRVATGQVGAATLGDIITIEGTITSAGVTKDLPYGWKLWVDDGSGAAQVYLNRTTDIDPHAPYLKAGKRLRVTGFGNQYTAGSINTYEVDPRSKRDLTPLP